MDKQERMPRNKLKEWCPECEHWSICARENGWTSLDGPSATYCPDYIKKETKAHNRRAKGRKG